MLKTICNSAIFQAQGGMMSRAEKRRAKKKAARKAKRLAAAAMKAVDLIEPPQVKEVAIPTEEEVRLVEAQLVTLQSRGFMVRCGWVEPIAGEQALPSLWRCKSEPALNLLDFGTLLTAQTEAKEALTGLDLSEEGTRCTSKATSDATSDETEAPLLEAEPLTAEPPTIEPPSAPPAEEDFPVDKPSSSPIDSCGNQARAKVIITPRTGVKFQDVAGIDEVKEELAEVVDFLKAPKRFVKGGGKIPKGVLLTGCQGADARLIAKGLAGECGVPFIQASASNFMEPEGASLVREMFKQAKEKASCIVFINEIDAIGRRGAAMGSLKELLVEMDGSVRVIVVAATERAKDLDKALLRPGRFDRRATVGPKIMLAKALVAV